MAERRPLHRDIFEAHREAKEIGPYPSWDRWKISLISRFGGKIPDEAEVHLHEWYVLRRKRQLGRISEGEMNLLQKSFSEEHEEFFNDERVISAFRFVTEKTSAKSD